MPRKAYKKRTYKKRTYKRRYNRRYRRYRRYNRIKKPEIHISKNVVDILGSSSTKNGDFVNITYIGGNPTANSDDIKYTLNGAEIQGRKIRLKYLYIKGYLGFTGSFDDDINGKFYIFRWQKNIANSSMTWSKVLDMPINLDTPVNWTQENIRDILYCYDWKNDLKGQIKHYVKKIYAKYDNTNNIIPFKIRIPLYDCVLTCDSSYVSSTGQFSPMTAPSTNGIYISYVSTTPNNENVSLRLKWKIYYTDY